LFEDRLLGHTQRVVVPVRSLFVLTANNPALSGEMAGRSVLIRLDPKIEDPFTRTGFLHPQLEAWTLEHRGRLLGAVLTLGQAWLVAGRPRAAVTFGGFQDWAEILGGVLSLTGLANRRLLYEQADEENAHIRAFLAEWWTTHRETYVLVKDLLTIAKNHPLGLVGKNDQGLLVSLGRLVQRLEDRQYTLDAATVTVRRGRKSHSAVLWRLEQGSLDSLGSLTASMHVGARAVVGSTQTDSPTSPDSPDQDPEWIQGDLGGHS
jgi:putative DNA primase/helicase